MNIAINKARWAAVKTNSKFICIETGSGYRNGRRDPEGSQHLLGLDASDLELGRAVIDSLSKSRFIVAAPEDGVWIHPEATFDLAFYNYKKSGEHYQAWIDNLMARFGYRSRSALFKGMKSCLITDVEGQLTFEPMRHIKQEVWEGMRGEVESVVIATNSSPDEIGAALLLALGRCV
jgi:hypothetical protein